ncbi:hypothetical protein Tco_0767333, partial [Tanacetum coccineum]
EKKWVFKRSIKGEWQATITMEKGKPESGEYLGTSISALELTAFILELLIVMKDFAMTRAMGNTDLPEAVCPMDFDKYDYLEKAVENSDAPKSEERANGVEETDKNIGRLKT